MAKVLKLLHVVGLALFLGSIFGHIVSSILGGDPGGSATFITARRHILLASQILTMPGLYLAMASGFAMLLVSGRRETWMLAHGALGVVVGIVAVTVVMPTVKSVLDGAIAVSQGRAIASTVASLYQRESLFGGINILLCLCMMVLAIWRPPLQKTQQSAAGDSA